MNIVVLVRQVPETEIRVKLAEGGKSVDLTGVKMVVNPFDEFAIEEALLLREAAGEGSVTVITVGVGGDESVQALRTGLAMGADSAIRILTDDAGGSYAVASLLAAVLKDKEFDLILCGKHAVGWDNNQVPQMLSVLLELPVVTTVREFEISAGRYSARRQIEGMTEVVDGSLPAIISVDKTKHDPRYPSLKGIMAAKRATIEEFDAAELGVDSSLPGGDGSSLELVNIELPPPRADGVIVEAGDDPAGAARQLADWLKNETGLI